MLTSLQKTSGRKVLAHDVTKADGPFMCPKCAEETILKKGMIKVHHFAHKPPINCEYGQGESEEHRRCKNEIYEHLCRLGGAICELEKDLGSVVPDIFIDFGENKGKVAIEVQISALTMQQIIHRTKEYCKKGIFILWISIYNPNLEKEKYAPKSWEKWLHTVYYGRVYYWQKELQLLPIHFDDYLLYVEESEWYDPYGGHQYGGGYHKKSKRYRTPKPGTPVNINSDFQGQHRKSWSKGDIFVPECRIIIDKLPNWWT